MRLLLTGEDGVTFGKHVNKALPTRGRPEVSLHKAPRASHAMRCEHSKHSRKGHQSSTDIETDLASQTLSHSQEFHNKNLKFSFLSQVFPIHPVTLGTSFSQHLPSNHNHRSTRLPVAISGVKRHVHCKLQLQDVTVSHSQSPRCRHRLG